MDLETRLDTLERANRRMRLIITGGLVIGMAGLAMAAGKATTAPSDYTALTVDLNSGVTRNGRRFVDLYRLKADGTVERGAQPARGAWQWQKVE